jgi:erythromycin esterase-like protein
MKAAGRKLGEIAWISVILSFLLAACAENTGGAKAAPQAGAAAPAASAAQWGARPITGEPADYDPLLSAVGEARFVLLGESTHGTSEFYRERARITQRLVREKGVLAVAIEADQPDADRLSRYVRGLGPDRSAAEALSDFERFPRWMWRNAEFQGLVEGLRAYNLTLPPSAACGVYGMDVRT